MPQGRQLVSEFIEVNGRQIALDKEGFLIELQDWSVPLAEALARREGVAYTAAHHEVIETLRRFYQTYQLSPAMRPLVKFIAQELGPEKGNSLYLLSLFPGSPAKLASKIAGLPKPDNCL